MIAKTRTDRLRIDSAGGETGSNIDRFRAGLLAGIFQQRWVHA